MPAPDNASFEVPGAGAGEADDWTVTVTVTGPLIADFGDDGFPYPIETFTGGSWGTNPYSFTLDPMGGHFAIFDGEATPTESLIEHFGRWFDNHNYRTTVAGGVGATFDSNTTTREDFLHASWGTAPYATEVSIAAGNMGATFSETFTGWGGAYITEVSGGTAATFYGGFEDVEGFEDAQPDVLFVVDDPTTGVCTTPAGPHGLFIGFQATILSTGARPTNIAANQMYRLVNVGLDDFQLTKTPAGTPITFGDYGYGSHYLHADERFYWTVGTEF